MEPLAMAVVSLQVPDAELSGVELMWELAKKPDKSARRAASERRSAKDAGFDRWLGRQLHAIYDPVLEEELPENLRVLLEGFAPGSAEDAGDAKAEDAAVEQKRGKRPK